jgi:hypothetical protein
MRRLLFVFFCGLLASPVMAQQVPVAADDPVAGARFRLGVVGLDPRASVRDIGVDTNVFNTSTNEQQDFTLTLVPGTKLYLRTGKGLLTVDGEAHFIYFNRFSSERSVTSSVEGQYELRFNRIRPYVSARSLNTRERPGYEIDKRVRHFESDYHVGTDLRIASKGVVRVDLRHQDYTIPSDEIFQDRVLADELNRGLNVIDLGWRQRLTALTTWVAQVSRESERFDRNEIRNSDSTRVSTGFELGRFALIRGTAFVGYRKLKSADGGLLPEFSGATADVDVAYTAPTQTRLTFAVNRDVQYSYERRTPYYLQTGWTSALTQRIIGKWDARVVGGRDRLAYQPLPEFLAFERTDHVDRLGGGMGYNLNDGTRVSFDVTSYRRNSDLVGHDYHGLKAGMSVTYGY